MVSEQIERLLESRPFRGFEMLLSDQRKVTVENLDFASLLGDRRSIVVHTLPDEAEVINLGLVVSLKFREPDLMLNLEL